MIALLKKGLNSNQLKIIALIAMTCDHVGKQLFPQILILQIIGRIAFPIFSYMIAEGCRYTRNRNRYLGGIIACAFACQIVYFIMLKSLYQCILVTFTISIVLIWIIDNAERKRDIKSIALAIIVLLCTYIITELVPFILSETDFYIDYGFFGVMFPIFIFMAKEKSYKLIMAGIGLILLACSIGSIQWYSLLSLLLLSVYNGKRGNLNIKYLFYIYYPLHLVVIYMISRII